MLWSTEQSQKHVFTYEYPRLCRCLSSWRRQAISRRVLLTCGLKQVDEKKPLTPGTWTEIPISTILRIPINLVRVSIVSTFGHHNGKTYKSSQSISNLKVSRSCRPFDASAQIIGPFKHTSISSRSVFQFALILFINKINLPHLSHAFFGLDSMRSRDHQRTLHIKSKRDDLFDFSERSFLLTAETCIIHHDSDPLWSIIWYRKCVSHLGTSLPGKQMTIRRIAWRQSNERRGEALVHRYLYMHWHRSAELNRLRVTHPLIYMTTSFKYARMHSSVSIGEILSCDDDERLKHLVHMFDEYQMTGKRYEAKAWHAYFRRIATNPIVFYHYNAAIFYEDNQHDHDTFEITEPTVIHGNLHMNQFHYYWTISTMNAFLFLRKHRRIVAPFTWDLKRLATNLGLVAYQHGFSDTEMIEVLHAFVRQYIRSVALISRKTSLMPQNSHEEDRCDETKKPLYGKQCSVPVLMDIQHKMHEIDLANHG